MKTFLRFALLLVIMSMAPYPSSAQWVQSNGLNGEYVHGIAVSGSKLIAGTDPHGAFVSADNGANWSLADTGMGSGAVYALFADGNNLFAGRSDGLYRSTDNGATWAVQNTGLTIGNPNTWISAFAVNGNNLFTAIYREGVYVSTDSGTSWVQINSGLSNQNVNALIVSGGNLLAGTDGGMFLSTDNGTSWSAANSGLASGSVTSITVNGNALYAGVGYAGVFLSTNNGASWTAENTGLTNFVIYSLDAIGSDVFAGTGNGIFLSTNNGSTWNAVDSGLTNTEILSILASGNNIFAGTGNGVWRRSLAEMTAASITSRAYTIYRDTLPNNFPAGGVWFVKENSGSVWVCGDNQLIAKADTSNLYQWTMMNNGIPVDSVGINWLEFVTSNTIFAAGMNGAIYKTTNGGNSWTSVYYNPSLTRFIDRITFFDQYHGFAWGDGLSQTSLQACLETTDGGATWTNNNSFTISSASFQIVRFVPPSNVFLLGFHSLNDNLKGLWRSNNGGRNWSYASVGTSSKDSITLSSSVDFRDSLNGVICRNDSTIWITQDGGITWQQFSSALPTAFDYASFIPGTSIAAFAGGGHGDVAQADLNANQITILQDTTKNRAFSYLDFPTTSRGYLANGLVHAFYSTGLSQFNGGSTSWRMQITSHIGSSNDNQNYLGVAASASDGFDSADDIPEPPVSPGKYISLYFPHPEWNSPLGNNFASDIRAVSPLADTVKRWYFQVKTNVINDTVTLSFINNGIPSGLGRYLTDLTAGVRINLKNCTTYKYFHGADSTAHSFLVMVGDSTAPSLSLIKPNASTIWRSGTTRTIQWSSSDRTGIDSIFIYSSLNGGATYMPVASLGFVQSYNWTVPNEYLNSLYAIKIIARDSVGNLSTVKSAQTFTVVGDSLSTTNPVGWSLFSLPLSPNNPLTNSILGDSSYVWGYTQDSGYVQPNTLAIGQGYWLGLLSPVPWFVEGTATESDSTMQTLDTGYTIIGNNYVKPVTKESMSFMNAGTEYSFADAATAGLIVNVMYEYDSTGYTDADTLLPFGGGWIASLQNGIELVQKPTLSNIVPPANKRIAVQPLKNKSAASTSYWSLAIQAANGPSTDKIFAVGVEPMSTNGFDAKYDAPRPPRGPGANYLELYTIHNGGNYPVFLGSRYAKDFRDSAGATWSFTVESSKNGTITLSWDKSQLSGTARKVILVDNVNGQSIDMSSLNTYAFTYSSPHSFTINGTTTKVDVNSGSLPTVYALTQNYPNPFNPSTKISYQLPSNSLVTLKVYDIIGREVTTLVNAQQNAGEYEVIFDASRLASGVYFYRIQAGTFADTKKLLLMK